MKKLITRLGVSLMILSAVTFTVTAQKGKDKEDKKEQHKDKSNGNKKDNGGKGNGKKQDNDQGLGNSDQKEDRGNKNKDKQKDKKDKDNNGQGSNGKNDNMAKGNNGKNDDKAKGNNGKNDDDNDYKWNKENFKDREKIKNKEKVVICHKFNNDNEPAVSIKVSSNAVKAHLKHGDVMGECPSVSNTRFSKKYLDKRNEYYNTLQNTQEQVVYSRSILDYAVARLTASRAELAALKSRNLAQEEIDRKQATVVELEQNVTLLESLIGVAANIVINKLQQ